MATFITPNVIASRGIATLYNVLTFAALVWRDFDSEFSGKQGDTITVRKPATFEAEDFVRANGITLQDPQEDSIPLVLDKIANVSFPVTDEETTLEVSDFQEQLLTPATQALAQKLDGAVAEEVADAARAAGYVGDATGSNPANLAFRQARAQLGRNNLPQANRYAVVSPEAAAEALGDELLIAVDKSGSTQGLREGILGRLLAFETYESPVLGEGAGTKGEVDGVAFHRDAVTLAVRPLDVPRGVPSDKASRANFGGLSIRVVYAYNNTYKQDEVSLDVLYGIETTRDNAAVELDFGQGS